MKLIFSKSAARQYAVLKADAPDTAGKVKAIVKDILSHPAEGLGAPTKLEGSLSGLWQRAFAPGNVITYMFDDTSVTIASIGEMESNQQVINLEAYSEQEEKAVMNQMSGNRGKDKVRPSVIL